MNEERRKEDQEKCTNRSTPLPWLGAVRRSRGLTQQELAHLAGVSANTVRLLEGERRGSYPVTLRKLAAALGVPPAELVREHRPQ